jgi:eukaryotic-like serine/threonine-protein kinase
MFLDVPEHDARSDVFSLAATIVDLMSRIERGQVTPLARDDIPRSFAAVLARGMAPRREDRYPSALEFGRALQRVELELGFAPTTLEIADTVHETNIVVDAPDAAETRVRSLPTIVPDAPTAQPPVALPSDAAPAPADVLPAPDAGPSRARLVGVLVGVVSLLVIAGVVVTIVLTGGPIDRPGPDPAPTSTGGSAVGQGTVPVATEGTATPSADGTAVTFTWVNPDPQDGDVYYWARAETPATRTAVEQTEVVVDGITPGSRVCLNVEIGRAGRTSQPLVICTA